VEAGGKLGSSLEVTRHLTDQYSNPLTVSFRRSTFAIRKSDSNTSGTVLEKLMDAGENCAFPAPFHISLRGFEAVKGQ
jgi:hypothetical protein